ncbi:hypothetical protein [Microlunatus soli]|uniref:Uncharacterized protein n=1 Tax=Microlunatus soli TaxID=630515 RepID=A0A1H2ALB7_9ACTN|nr:hypothetical protein [Microlunatus soli]SDT46669.1 hypothetical protein SAMN04489812_6029 [Microlunatus soli]
MTDFEPWAAHFEVLALRREDVDLDWTRVDAVELVVGGRDFRDWVAEAERQESGGRELAGQYLGLSATEVDWPDHLLGRTPETGEDDYRWDGRTVLLGCSCGTIGCWPLYGRITVDTGSVFWYDFANPHRDWTYAGLPPFRFDRAGYERELARFASTVG